MSSRLGVNVVLSARDRLSPVLRATTANVSALSTNSSRSFNRLSANSSTATRTVSSNLNTISSSSNRSTDSLEDLERDGSNALNGLSFNDISFEYRVIYRRVVNVAS